VSKIASLKNYICVILLLKKTALQKKRFTQMKQQWRNRFAYFCVYRTH